MTKLTNLAQGFGFVETRARSLSVLTEKAAQMPPTAPVGNRASGNYEQNARSPGLDGIMGNDDDTYGWFRGQPVKQSLLDHWQGAPSNRPRNYAATIGAGPVAAPIPPAVVPPANPAQRYASPGDPRLQSQGVDAFNIPNRPTHRPWGESLPAMPGSWDPNSTRFYGSYAKGYPNWRQNHAGPDGIMGNADDKQVPYTNADLWRNMNIQIASMRQAERSSTGQAPLELASKAYAEPTQAEYEGRFSKFRHPGDTFYSRTQQARQRGRRPLNMAGPGAATPAVPFRNNAAVTAQQGNLRTSGKANRLAQETYGRTNYPDVYNNTLGGDTATRWPYHGPDKYVTPGRFNVKANKIIQ